MNYTHTVTVLCNDGTVTNFGSYSLTGARAIASHLAKGEVAHIFDLNGSTRPIETHSYVAAAA